MAGQVELQACPPIAVSDLSFPVVVIVAVLMGIAMVLTGRWMFRRKTL